MPCYRPLQAWRQRGNDPGQPKITFTKHDDMATGIQLPCGQCIGCRLERSRRWAVRIMHEAQQHEANSFLTLTYDDDQLPKDGSLNKEHFQLFMKRLRRRSSSPLRFFHCGEYGDENLRPHYHACIFGDDFLDDRVQDKITQAGDKLYTSKRLSEVWTYGYSWIGALTFESAAYVARYCLKKVTGKKAEAHYAGRTPEYVTMSRRPGIGADWFLRYSREVYPSDSVVMRGKEMMPPPYYDKLLEKTDPRLYEAIKKERASEQLSPSDCDYEQWVEHFGTRLRVKEEVKEKTIKTTLKRSI